MNKILVNIAILGVLLFQSVGITLWYQLDRNQCFEAFLENIDLKTQTIVFDKESDIIWSIKNREFVLNDKLFDVISILKTDKIKIVCHADEREDLVIAKYKETKQKTEEVFKKILREEYVSEEPNFKINNYSLMSGVSSIPYTFTYGWRWNKPNSPPPKMNSYFIII